VTVGYYMYTGTPEVTWGLVFLMAVCLGIAAVTAVLEKAG